MTIAETYSEDNIILVISGRIEAINSDELQNAILKAFQRNKNVILDMNDVPYISSAGLRALLIGMKTANSKGGKFLLINCSAAVKEIIRVTGLDRMFSVQ